jgi:hypothetical protein
VEEKQAMWKTMYAFAHHQDLLVDAKHASLLAQTDGRRKLHRQATPERGLRVDGKTFDATIRQLATRLSRRGLLGAASALTLGIAAARATDEIEARKRKNKTRAKKLQLNAFQCVDVGKACRGSDANCCSGICQGKKPKKGDKDKSRCVAHDTGDCQDVQDVCLEVEIACGTGGACLRTTGNASFCGDGGQCASCQTDSDCEAAGFLEGAACVVCSDWAPSGVACFRAGA